MVEVHLLELGIALTTLAVVGALAARVSLSVIPAYIVAGVLVGPEWPTSILGVPLTPVEYGELMEVLAEVGVVLLLFFLGLEFSITKLLDQRRQIAAAGSVDFLFNFGAGIALGLALGYGWLATLFVAGIVYISSSAVITKSIVENGWVANPEGDAILGTLVFEDLLIAIYLAVLSALVLGGGDLLDAVVAVGTAFCFLGVLGAVAWFGTEYVERAFAVGDDELFLLRVLGVTVLVSGAALWLGLSEAVAAFFVGMAFSNTELVDQIEDQLGPARDLFAAVFFFAIGLQTDVLLLGEAALLLGAAVVLTTGTKLLSGTLSGRLYDLSRLRSVRVGVGLVPRGEFSLIIAALVLSSGGRAALGDAVATELNAFAVGYVLVMSVLGTVLIHRSEWITDRVVADRTAGG